MYINSDNITDDKFYNIFYKLLVKVFSFINIIIIISY